MLLEIRWDNGYEVFWKVKSVMPGLETCDSPARVIICHFSLAPPSRHHYHPSRCPYHHSHTYSLSLFLSFSPDESSHWIFSCVGLISVIWYALIILKFFPDLWLCALFSCLMMFPCVLFLPFLSELVYFINLFKEPVFYWFDHLFDI